MAGAGRGRRRRRTGRRCGCAPPPPPSSRSPGNAWRRRHGGRRTGPASPPWMPLISVLPAHVLRNPNPLPLSLASPLLASIGDAWRRSGRQQPARRRGGGRLGWVHAAEAWCTVERGRDARLRRRRRTALQEKEQDRARFSYLRDWSPCNLFGAKANFITTGQQFSPRSSKMDCSWPPLLSGALNFIGDDLCRY
jgi:hypothetical protein